MVRLRPGAPVQAGRGVPLQLLPPLGRLPQRGAKCGVSRCAQRLSGGGRRTHPPPAALGQERTHRVVDALARSGLIGDAGVQTSLQETGLQWDAPNWCAAVAQLMPAHALTHTSVQLGAHPGHFGRGPERHWRAEGGAARSRHRHPVAGASLAPSSPPPTEFTHSLPAPQLSNYLGWKRSNCFEMHEKYHSALAGERGAGGEYLPQVRVPTKAAWLA